MRLIDDSSMNDDSIVHVILVGNCYGYSCTLYSMFLFDSAHGRVDEEQVSFVVYPYRGDVGRTV